MTFEYIISLVRRAMPLVLAGMLGFGAVALGYSLFSPKLYQATTRVIVESDAAPITVDPDQPSRPGMMDENAVDTEVEVLESSVIAERVAREAKLASDPEFGGSTKAMAAMALDHALTIKRVGMTSLIDISVDSRSPERAAKLANLTGQAYVQIQKERKRANTLDASRQLGERAQALAGQVREAEAKVQNYRIANNLMSVNGATLAEQSAAEINDRLASARAEESAAIGALAAASRASSTLNQANAQGSLGTLRAQQATAMQEMSAARATYGEMHPTYIAAAQRLEQINRAVADETTRARSAIAATRDQSLSDLRTRVAAASNLRRSLEGSAGANSNGLRRNSQASAELGDLERSAAALRSTYETVLTRYRQTLTQLGTERGRSQVLSPATPPESNYRPRTLFNLAIGLLAGLVCGLAVVAITSLLETHFSTGRQVQNELGVEALPSLPTAKSAELGDTRDTTEIAALMRSEPTGSFAEMHKNVITAIDRPTAKGANKIVEITSSLPKEGKTTTAICLAQAAAMHGKRVLLVDGDQRRRGVTRAIAPNAIKGLREALTGDWRSAIVTTEMPGVELLPASGGATDLAPLATDALPTLLAQLRDVYDLVLIDTAPVLPVADARLIAEHVDSVIFLCRWRSTSRNAVASALDLLGALDIPLAGVSLTQVDLQAQAKFGFGDPAFYYQQYKGYYNTTNAS